MRSVRQVRADDAARGVPGDSSVLGNLAGTAWTDDAWPGVVTLSALLLCAAGLLTLVLRRTPALLAAAAR
jgi:YNFM family putative membrane transporter